MKLEEMVLAKARNLMKPEPNEISSMYNKIYTKLVPEAAAFNLPLFNESFE